MLIPILLSVSLGLHALARPQGPWQGHGQGPPQGPWNQHGQWSQLHVPAPSSSTSSHAQTSSPSTLRAQTSGSTKSSRTASFLSSISTHPSETGSIFRTQSTEESGYISQTGPASIQTSPAIVVTFSSETSARSTTRRPASTVTSKPISTPIVAPVATTAASSNSPTSTDFIRGVNIGGWLLVEKFMNGDDLFTGSGKDAVDQWTFDQTSGAAAALQTHWDTYFTEADVQTLKGYGINALRIPIGFWAYDNTGTPYISYGIGKGADSYLEKAISWAQSNSMGVWIDCHGSPGSQNGYDNSGHLGDVEWQQGDNLAQSIAILTTMAQKYGSKDYSGTVLGIELVNEPISWGNNVLSTTQSWAQEAYHAVKGNSTNEDLMVVMHDAFASNGPSDWTAIAQSLGPRGVFGIDTHMYQTLVAADIALTQAEHIATACDRGMALKAANELAPVFVGEWTSTTNACINPDLSSTAQTCTKDGCVCVTAPMSTWTDAVVEEVRRYVEAQLESFEASTSGYFMWSWADDDMGTWSIKDGINKGIIPNPLNDPSQRKYPGQCAS